MTGLKHTPEPGGRLPTFKQLAEWERTHKWIMFKRWLWFKFAPDSWILARSQREWGDAPRVGKGSDGATSPSRRKVRRGAL